MFVFYKYQRPVLRLTAAVKSRPVPVLLAGANSFTPSENQKGMARMSTGSYQEAATIDPHSSARRLLDTARTDRVSVQLTCVFNN